MNETKIVRWGASFWARLWVRFGRWMMPFTEPGRRKYRREARAREQEQEWLFHLLREERKRHREEEEAFRRDIAAIARAIREGWSLPDRNTK